MSPVSPTPDCITRKFREFYKWEFKYLVGYLSNTHMIRYGIYHMFVSGLFCEPILCFVLICGIRVASVSSVDSLPYSRWFSHISMGILILLDHRDCHLNSISNRCVSLRDDPTILPIRKINYKFSQRCLFHLPQVAFVFPPSHPFIQGFRFLNQVSFY